MKLDREQKRARLGEHLPDFPDYRKPDLGDTDLQLRRVLAGQTETVRDRLAEFIAGADLGRLRDRFARTLRASAALKDLFIPGPEEKRAIRSCSPAEEEKVFDLDLALLERVSALHSLIDRLEAAATPADLVEVLALLEEGLTETDELYRRREEVLRIQGRDV